MKGHLSLWMKSTTYNEEGSGDKFWECLVFKCTFLCRVVPPPPCLLFCSAKLLCHAQRDRIVSCYRQSCWHLLEFLFIRSSFLVFISLSNFCSCWDFLYLVSGLTSNLRAGCGFSVKIAIFCILYMFSCNFLHQRQGITWLIAGSNSLLYQGLQIKPAVNMLRAL